MNLKVCLTMCVLIASLLPSAALAQSQDCPNADVMLVIDRSGSMTIDDRIGAAKNASKLFVDLLDLGDDQAGLASFATGGSLDLGLTVNQTALEEAIDALFASGLTCISCGLNAGQGELVANGRSDVNHVLVLLSDGEPTTETPADAQAAADAAKAAGTIIFTIGIGTADPTLMQNMASEPSFFTPGTEDDLQDIFTEISGRICDDLPDDTPGHEVPEFSAVAGLLALGGAALLVVMRRR